MTTRTFATGVLVGLCALLLLGAGDRPSPSPGRYQLAIDGAGRVVILDTHSGVAKVFFTRETVVDGKTVHEYVAQNYDYRMRQFHQEVLGPDGRTIKRVWPVSKGASPEAALNDELVAADSAPIKRHFPLTGPSTHPKPANNFVLRTPPQSQQPDRQ